MALVSFSLTINNICPQCVEHLLYLRTYFWLWWNHDELYFKLHSKENNIYRVRSNLTEALRIIIPSLQMMKLRVRV